MRGWSPEILHICSMHVVNLGLGYRCNGSSMFPGWLIRLCWLNRSTWENKVEWTVIKSKSYLLVSLISCFGSATVVVPYRVCLLRVKYWGDHEGVQNALDESYLHFRDWCKRKNISTSQPPFKTWMVLWSNWFEEFVSSFVKKGNSNF